MDTSSESIRRLMDVKGRMDLVGKLGSRRNGSYLINNEAPEGRSCPKGRYGLDGRYDPKGDDKPNRAAQSSKITRHLKEGMMLKAPIVQLDSDYLKIYIYI